MERQLLRPSESAYIASRGDESSLSYSDIESDSIIHMSFRIQEVHLLGWTIFTWMCQKSLYLPVCLSRCSLIDLNFFAADTLQISAS